MTLGKPNRFLLLYGSETGQAKAIAEEIAENSTKHGLDAEMHCFSKTERKFWLERETCTVIIVSTTGDGEPPETVTKFFRRLKKRTLSDSHLSELHYTLLGLGDSNYTNFCNCGKSLNARLLQLGAQPFYAPGWADDATGLELVADPWMDGLWAALRSQLALPEGNPDQLRAGAEHPAACSLNGVDPEMADASDTCQTSIDPKQEAHCIPDPSSRRRDSNTGDVSNCDGTSSGAATSPLAEEVMGESLTVSLPPLCESPLNVPGVPAEYLHIAYLPQLQLNLDTLPFQNDCPLPSCSSPVTLSTVTGAHRLSRSDAIKTALKLELDITGVEWVYEAGDSIGILCTNPQAEVQALLERLQVAEDADTTYELSVIASTTKKNPSVPPHLPCRATLRHVLSCCCDIRSAPKKVLLRAFAAHASDVGEQRRLMELCSRQGSSHFTRFIREASLSILDLLIAFPSCQPRITTLLEHLPRLQPRPYSAASSALVHPGKIHIVFNIVDIPSGNGRHVKRRGVCTSWLADLTQHLQLSSHSDTMEEGLQALRLQEVQVPIYLRSNQHFRPPCDVRTPVVMIGPGTGVAPFIGFLQHRQYQLQTCGEECQPGACWLLYGCRHQERDFLFREELEGFSSSGLLTRFLACFSRDEQAPGVPRYVQDLVRDNSAELAHLLTDARTHFYVCGDALNMAREVSGALQWALCKEKGMSEKEAQNHMMQLRLHKFYFEDVWT